MRARTGGYGEGELTRRAFLRLGGLGLIGTVLVGQTGCGILGGGTASGSLTYATAGGALEDAVRGAWIDPYQEESGAQVTIDTPFDPSQLRAMVDNNQVTWDQVGIGQVLVPQIANDYLEPIDYSVLNADGVPQALRNEHGVGYMRWAFVLGFNKDRLESQPRSWQDFYNTQEFPGRRGLPPFVDANILETALLADGVSEDNLYPLDVDRAFAKLDTIRDSIVFWETDADSQQLLASGEISMSLIANGRAQSAIDEGRPVEIVWNQHFNKVDYQAIPKGAPNKEQAMELIAFMVAEDNNWRLSQYIPYAPTNKASVDQVPAEVAPELVTYQDRLSQGIDPDVEYIAQNLETLSERFNEWQLT